MVINRDFWLGLVVGTAAGFAAAILTAPESGARTREGLAARSIELKERATGFGEEAQRRAEEIQHKAAQTFEQEMQRATRVVQHETERIQGIVAEMAKKAPLQAETSVSPEQTA